jgi:hypothetical protein
VHHRRRDVDLGTRRPRIPFGEEPFGDLGHDGRIADDAAVVEGRRHDAAMPAPGLALAGEQPAAQTWLEQAPGDLRLVIVGGVVEQNMLDCAGLVDEEGALPEQSPFENVGSIGLGTVGRDRIVPKHAQELKERQRSLGHLRLGKPGRRRSGPPLVDDAHPAPRRG